MSKFLPNMQETANEQLKIISGIKQHASTDPASRHNLASDTSTDIFGTLLIMLPGSSVVITLAADSDGNSIDQLKLHTRHWW